MRFMMIMLPGPNAYKGTGIPDAKHVAEMAEYNKKLKQAGVLLSMDGLQPPTKGARVSYSSGKATVTDGPFIETKEIIGGYWLIEVKSKEEAVEWATRCPAGDEEVIEVRQVFEMADFPPDVQKAAAAQH